MRGIKELDQLNSPEEESSDDVSNSEAIGASATEEINPKNTDRAPAEKGRIRSPVVEGGGACPR